MNVKRTFGIILTVLGIAALIYFATLFIKCTFPSAARYMMRGGAESVVAGTGAGCVTP